MKRLLVAILVVALFVGVVFGVTLDGTSLSGTGTTTAYLKLDFDAQTGSFSTFTLGFDAQTGSWTVGNTVIGAINGATAKIASIVDAGTTGTLGLVDVVGTFVDDEIIYESALGGELITAQNNRDFSSENIGNWTLSTDGSGTLLYEGTDPGAEKVGELTAAGDETYMAAVLASTNHSSFVENNFYIAQTNFYVPNGNSENGKWMQVQLFGYGISDDNVSQKLSVDTWTQLTHRWLHDSADVIGDLFARYRFTPENGDILYYDDVSVKQVTNAALANGTLIPQTVVGATSGTTATISTVTDNGTTGTLDLAGITGTFQDNEIIYESALGSELITGTDSDMSGANNWAGANLGGFDINTTVAGKMWMQGDGGSDYASLAAVTTVNNYYRLSTKARLRAGGSTTIKMGTGFGADPPNIYTTLTPTGSEQTFTGYIGASGVNIALGLSGAGFNGIEFEIDDFSVKQVTNAALANGVIY